MTFNNPDKPQMGIVNIQETDMKIPYDPHKRYMSVVASLIYIVKHSRHELSNAVCELSKFMDEANMSHYKYLLCKTKYTIDTTKYWYQIKPDRNLNVPWAIQIYSDSDYAGYNGTQKSVKGYIILINGVVIACCSQIQKTVTLSVSEAVYSAITEVCW